MFFCNKMDKKDKKYKKKIKKIDKSFTLLYSQIYKNV